MFRGPVHACLASIVFWLSLLLLSAGAVSCGRRSARVQAPVAPARVGETETGIASWYGAPYHGRRTASGEVYDMERLTAAHRRLPFQTWVEVTNLENGRRVDVRITDRGPFAKGRIIDLSHAAARDIAMLGPGTAKVRIKVIAPRDARTSAGTPDTDSVEGSVTQRAGPLLVTYAVQAGAFADRERAEELRARLADRFGEARVLPTEAAPPLWRVVVGNGFTLDQANDLAVRLRQETGAAMVIVEPVARP